MVTSAASSKKLEMRPRLVWLEMEAVDDCDVAVTAEKRRWLLLSLLDMRRLEEEVWGKKKSRFYFTYHIKANETFS